MIQLFQFPRIWDLPNASPFCVKMETYLRLNQLPYQVKEVRDPRKAPKGKLPFIKDGDKIIADSSFIITYLKQTYGDKLDAQLSPQQQAIATAVQRLVEEHLYWIIFHSRWVLPEGWQKIKDEYFNGLPFPLQLFLPNMVRKKCIKDVYSQGIGRFTDDERLQLGKADLDTIVALLADQPYFFGDQPTSIDCSIWAAVTNLLNTPLKIPLQDYAKSLRALTDYDERMRQRFDQLEQVRN